MELMYRVKHLAHKAMLLVYGPAQLDAEHDPARKLDREFEEHRVERGKSPRTPEVEDKKRQVPEQKRHFNDGVDSKHAGQ